MILGKKLYENHGIIKGFLFSIPSIISIFLSRFKSNQAITEQQFSGTPFLVLDEKEKVLCNACRLCESACPTVAIEIKGPNSVDWTISSRPKDFRLDLLKCINCAICADVCSFDAIKMSGQNILAGDSRLNWVLDIEKMTKREGINLHLQEGLQSNQPQES